ncbi:DUF4198 domain-containing protein [uncultured Winogradskyella sp.]|uniref:DUF4198 domain-containing protein n=1 Tax=uncultured Winogradskyella sp. TaxID=395353 RepID=UPI002620873F|nr:DUF4198 domain-containing protein [uncultured Winogradskyella sp.]
MHKQNTKLSKALKHKFFKPLYYLIAIVLLCSHDLFIKLETYFLQPNQEATLSLFNGTFEKSDNIITRDRMLDASVVAQGERVAIEATKWEDQDSTITNLKFRTGESGTYVAGVSTKARNIELTAEKFNKYLKSDGVFDMLQQRTNDNLLDKDVVENYQKHVKAIYQVGDTKTNDWKTVLGYPIEFVPQANPYDKHTGDQLQAQLLLDGKPLAHQLIFADFIKSAHSHQHGRHEADHTHDEQEHSHSHSHDDAKHTHGNSETESHDHSHDEKTKDHEHSHNDGGHNHEHHDNVDSDKTHTHTSGQQLRTDDNGVATVDLTEDGIYYLRTIYMARATDSDEITHRSKWATLTFEVTHAHNADAHAHDHEHEDHIPTWVFVLGSLMIIGVLFFIFRKRA